MYPMLSLDRSKTVLDLSPLGDMFDNEIFPHLRAGKTIVDKEAVITGEAYLLMRVEHDPNRPTLRLLLKDFVIPEIAEALLTKFWNLTYRLLERVELNPGFEYEIEPIGGLCFSIQKIK